MKHQAKVGLVLLTVASAVANAQAHPNDLGLGAKTHLRGYWLDRSTRLVWSGTDNGKDVNWYQATNYCRELDFKGYSDWRLPTINELETIYAQGATPQRKISHFQSHEMVPLALNVKGNLSLTGNPWSSSDVNTDPSHPATHGWFFNFNQGSRIQDELISGRQRAVCVRRSDVVPPKSSRVVEAPAKEIQSSGCWIDTSTGLMWAANDSGRSVTWGHARKYCRNLRFAGYADWRLATLDELETLVVNGAYDPHRVESTDHLIVAVAGSPDVRGGLNLVDDPWSSNRPLNAFHRPYSDGWF